MPRFSAGSASVSIVPDMSGFHRSLQADLAKISGITIKVQPDLTGFVSQVRAEMAKLRADPVKIPVRPELESGARRSIQAQLSGMKSTVKVDADTSNATRALKVLGATAGSALGALAGQAATGGLLAIAGAAAQAGAALALLPALGVAAAAPIAALAIGAQGLGDAFKAFGKAAEEGAANAASNAAAAKAAAQQHEAAQKAVASAGRQVVSAERQVADAQRTSRKAQEELTRAREEAADRLEDLNMQLRASALDEEAAVLSVERAQARLAEATAAGSEASSLERREADLGYRQAVQSLEEIRASNARLAEETAQANAAGVEGSEQVRSAHEGIADAARGEIEAQEGLQLAQQQLAEAVEDLGNISVAAAAQTSSLSKAMENLSPVAQAFVNQIHELGPAWRDLRFDVQDKLLAGLGDSITKLATTQLPVLKEGLGGLAEVMNEAARQSLDVFSTPAAAGDFATTLGNIRTAAAGAFGGMAPLSQAFIDMATVGSSFLPKMGDALGGVSQRFAEWVAQARESGELEAMIQRALDVISQIGVVLKNVGSIFSSIMEAGAETGGGLLAMLGEITGQVAAFFKSTEGQGALQAFFASAMEAVKAIAPLLGQVGQILLGTVLPAILDLGAQLAPVASMLLGALGTALEAIAPLVPLVGQAIGELVQAFLPLIPIITQLISTLLPPLITIFEAWWPVLSDIIVAIGDALIVAFDALLPVLPIVLTAFEELTNAILPLLPVMLELITDLVPPLAGLIAALAPVVVQVLEAFLPLLPVITELAASLIPPLLEIIEALLPIVSELAVIIAGAFMDAFEELKPLFPVLISAFMRIVEALLPLLPVIVELISALLPPLVSIFSAMFPVIEALAPVIATLVEAIAPLITQIAELLIPIMETFGEVIASVWGAVGDTIAWVIDHIIKPAVEAFGSTIGWLQSAFGTAMDGIGAAWDRIKGIVAAPVNFVVRTVLRDGLFSAWNWVLDKLGIDSWKIDLSAGWLQGIDGYASGGLIRGPWQGPAADNVLARLNPREFVQPVAAVDHYGVEFMEAVRTGRFPAEIARGYLPGLASGGQLASAVKKQFPDARITSMLRPGDRGYHGRGMAVDIAGPTPSSTGNVFMAQVEQWIAQTFGKGTSELIYDGAGNRIADLRNGAAHVYSAATQAEHRNHVHWAMAGSLLGALGDVALTSSATVSRPWYQDLWSSITGAYEWLSNGIAKVAEMAGRFGDGPLTAWISELPGNLVEGMWDNIAGPIGDLFGGGESGGSHDIGHVLVRDSGGPIYPGWNTIYNGTGRNEWALSPRQAQAYLTGSGGGGAGSLVGAVLSGTLDLGDGLEGRIDARVVDVLTSATDRGRYNG